MADLENSKWPPQKNLVFQLRQFSIFFHEIFMVWSLQGLIPSPMFLFWFTRDQFALISYNSVVRALVSLLRTVSSQFFFQKMPQTFDKFSSVKSNAKVPKNKKKKIRPLYYCKFTISSTSFCENVISETSWFENSSFF